ncbi:MAG: lytic transglycosylase domain-containing protein [Holosporales bacterium]|jgi:soluble lytic murein transglycosylase
MTLHLVIVYAMRFFFILLFTVVCTLPAQAASIAINDDDVEILRRALQAGDDGNWAGALNTGKKASDPVVRDIVAWSWLRFDDVEPSFSDYQRFLKERPDFPQRALLLRRAEANIDLNAVDDEWALWLVDNPPQTTRGRWAQLILLDRDGNTREARDLAKDIWISSDFSSDSEENFQISFGKYLTQDDHHNRLDHLMWEKQYGQAARMRTLVRSAHWELAEARRLLQTGHKDADVAYHNVEPRLRGTPGISYDRIVWRRKRGDDEAANDLIRRAPRPNGFVEDWWNERELQARRAQARKDYEAAYTIASNHGMVAGEKNFVDGEFLAGWIALEYLKDSEKSEEHFKNMVDAAQFPITKARAQYWLSRAAKANGDRSLASEMLNAAASNPTTFYGQVASAEMHLPPRLDIVYRKVDADVRFEDNPLARAIRYLQAAGLDRRAVPFAIALFEADKSYENLTALTSFLQRQGRPDLALDIAKRARQDGVVIVDAEFPLLLLPQRVESPEPGLIHAIIRQESVFAPSALSPVGARGLMQLMPATAKIEAKTVGLPFSPVELTRDPKYNIILGAAHLDRLINQFDGYYPMIAAAYNAGAGNVNKWVATFGDPRTDEVSMLNWMESIPFRETRNYVQRVMEGVEVYRIRLAGIEGFEDGRNVHRNAWCTLSCGLLPEDKGSRLFSQKRE